MATYDLANKRQPLEEMTDEIRQNKSIKWYRTKLSKDEMRQVNQRSDALGFAQTLGYLAVIATTGALTIWSSAHWPWWATLLLVFLHGTCTAFLINAVHELGHGTVFQTKIFNRIFVHIFAFLGWINHEKFATSHTRHHRFTLHPPDDLEVVLPIRIMVRHYLKSAFVDPRSFWNTLKQTIRVARGQFQGDWELTIYPEETPHTRKPTVRWARILLIGHGAIFVVSLLMGWWIVPVVISLNSFHSNWLFFLANNTQHVGLQDNVDDFRQCCRTFTCNPIVQFLYWHMNFHIEHHMYAAVPCYRLGKLHRMIRHDLAPCPHGLVATWREIIAILKKQEVDPTYQHVAAVPQNS